MIHEFFCGMVKVSVGEKKHTLLCDAIHSVISGKQRWKGQIWYWIFVNDETLNGETVEDV